MATPTLQGLPVEVLNEICSYLCSHCVSTQHRQPKESDRSAPSSPRTLLALCSTSRFFRDVATPYLYHYIQLQRGQTIGRDFAPLVPLLRTMIERPDIASHVRWIEIEFQNIYTAEFNWTEMERMVYEAALRCNMALAPDWYTRSRSDVRFDLYEICIELLLLLPRNLERIEFEARESWQFQSLVDASQPSPCAPALRVLSTTPALRPFEDGPSPTEVVNFQPIMGIAPLLHTFISNLCTYEPAMPCPGIARVKNLYLSNSSIAQESLEEVIASHTRLETFEGFMEDTDWGHVLFLWDLIGVLRKYHARSLRKMSVNLSLADAAPGVMTPDNYRALSMKEFSSLESLCIYNCISPLLDDLEFLKGSAFVDLLPQKSLKQLYFCSFLDSALIDILKALASRIEFEGHFPCLKEIHVGSGAGDTGSLAHWALKEPGADELTAEAIKELAVALGARFGHLGVELFVVRPPMDNTDPREARYVDDPADEWLRWRASTVL